MAGLQEALMRYSRNAHGRGANQKMVNQAYEALRNQDYSGIPGKNPGQFSAAMMYQDGMRNQPLGTRGGDEFYQGAGETLGYTFPGGNAGDARGWMGYPQGPDTEGSKFNSMFDSLPPDIQRQLLVQMERYMGGYPADATQHYPPFQK